MNLTPQQMSILIKALKYIMPRQTKFYSGQSIDEIIQERYANISTIVKSCLQDNYIFFGDLKSKHALSVLERFVHEFYS